MVMSLKELEEQLKSAEEEVVSSLEEYKNAKATLRKARITSISTKLLAPFRRFRIEQAITKYDAMIEKLEKKREKEIRRAEKLQEKEEKLERKQAKEDFKVAIRDKRKEDIVNFVNDRKDDVINFVDDKKSDVINFGREISSEVSDTFSYIREIGASRVSSASSFAINVKNSAIKKVKENTTIDLTIKNAIEEVKLKYATNKLNRAVEQKKKEEEQARLEELNSAIKFDEEIKADYKERDVPFANINEKIQKASRQSSYMGKATNRVVRYFKSKKDNLFSDISDKVYESGFNIRVSAYETMGKVSKSMSQIKTVFNNELSDLKANVNDRYNSIKRDIKSNIDSVSYAYQEAKEKKEAERVNKEQELAIKRAQLDSMRAALETVNNTGDIFSNVPSLDAEKTR